MSLAYVIVVGMSGGLGERIGSSGSLRTALKYLDGVVLPRTSRRGLRFLVFVLVTGSWDGR